jgi:hypothetical protein
MILAGCMSVFMPRRLHLYGVGAGCYFATICDEIFSASLDIKGITYISKQGEWTIYNRTSDYWIQIKKSNNLY